MSSTPLSLPLKIHVISAKRAIVSSGVWGALHLQGRWAMLGLSYPASTVSSAVWLRWICLQLWKRWMEWTVDPWHHPVPAAYMRAVQNSWWFPQTPPVPPPLCRPRLSGAGEPSSCPYPQALLMHSAIPDARKLGGHFIVATEIRILVEFKWVGPCICFLHFLLCSGIKGCLLLDLRKQNQGIANYSYEMLPVCKDKLLGFFFVELNAV